MAAIGGSIETVSFAGREFPVTADADVARRLGGKQNTVEMNGDGTARVIQTPTSWSLTGLVVQVDDTRNDQEYLQDIADSGEFVAIGVTYASGVTYQGQGTIVDELAMNNQSTAASVSVNGTGRLTPQ
jgi:hypothetical protein